MRRLRILLIAREFSPSQGSECAVGWNIAIRLAKFHDVTVLYASGSQFEPQSYQRSINDYFSKNKRITGLKLIHIDLPVVTRLIAAINSFFRKVGNIGLPFVYYIGYNFWQKAVYKKAKQINNYEKFDIVHQLTQITFREPGYLWRLGIPFFWGPTGGMSVIPDEFINSFAWHSRILEGYIRKYSNRFQFSFSNRVQKAIKKASVIYTFTQEDKLRFEKKAKGKVKIMLDVGTIQHSSNGKIKRKNSDKITGIWCGQLIDIKTPKILLQAIALSKITRENFKCLIVGTGPLENSLTNFVKDLGLKNIVWLKSIKHEEVFKIMSKSDFLIHTSVREATSSVIPEALSMGIPIVCHDAYGMSIAVNDNCGIKIPLISPDKSVKGFNQAIEKLILDQDLLDKLKKGAKERSLDLSWDNMAKTMADDYIKYGKM